MKTEKYRRGYTLEESVSGPFHKRSWLHIHPMLGRALLITLATVVLLLGVRLCW